MAAMKSGINLNFQNYNAAQENNVSKGISGPASLPPTPFLSEKNTFARRTLPSEIVEVADDQAPDLRVPHHLSAPGRLYENPSGNQHNLGYTPHLMPNPTGQQTQRINQPDVSSLNPNMMPLMGPYQPEPMPIRNNHSGFVYSDIHSTGFSNCTMSHTGSPSFSDQGIGSSSSAIGVSNPMLKPHTGPYLPVQQHIANGSNIDFSAHSMPLNTRMLDFTYSDPSNFGMLLQSGSHQTRPDLGYHSATTSCQNNSFQSKGPQYCRTGSQMDFPSTATSHPAGSLHREHPNGTNGLHIGSSNMVMPNSVHIEHQKSSTTEPVPGTSIPNLVVQPQVHSYKNSAFLTPPNNAEPSSTPNVPPQGSELEGRPYKEMVAEEEVATNQVTSENQGIDLNKTPQQKTRRRKYVPKVVIQGRKPRATKKTTPQNASEDRPKRKYVRKKGVEPPAAEANEAGRPVGNSDLLIQKDANLPSNPISITPSHTNNAADCVNKADDLPISSTSNAEFVRDKPIEAPQSSTPKAVNRTAQKKGSVDRPKRKYVKKKGVEPPPVETTVDANEAGRPVGTSDYITHKVTNLPNNPIASFPCGTSNDANCVNKADDLPASRTLNAEVMLDKLIEAPESCTAKGLNGHNQLAEESIPCTPTVTTGFNKQIDISCLSNMTMQNHHTVGGMSGPCKPVRRRLNFDAEEVRTDGYEQAQSQHTLNSVSVPPSRRNASTFPIETTSVQASKGIALDLNSTANQWHEFDRCFPPTPSTSIGGTDQMLGTCQATGRNMNTNLMPSGLGSFTGYPYPVLPRYANNSIVTPANNCQMGLYKENLASHTKRNDNLILQTSKSPYSNVPSLIPDGKRDYSALDSSTGLTGQVRAEHSPRIIETSKKIRIWNGNANGLNVTQNNISVLHNPSSTFPPVRPDGRVSCLADAQRLLELKKRNNAKMLSFRTLEGNLPGCTSNAPRTTNTPVKVAQAVNAASKDQINQLAVSFQTSSDRTAALNQCVNSSGSHPCRLITSVISGKETVTLEMLAGSGSMNTTSTQPVDHIIRSHAANGIARSESCQGVSETATQKPLADTCPPPSTPAKSPKLNPTSKSEPRRRGRPPKSENACADSLVSPRPKGRPRGKKSSLGSANLMVGGPAALDYTIDLIVQKMSGLDINRISETVPGQPCYALVPYQSGVSDGQIVLYDEGILKKKKRKSRAQVNLDPVTSQVWNLLMGKEMKDGIETVNENDEKKMEAEREVFRGRIDSFIARMHLVQGDRRFSPWKGSVVDSVVGVFLTQNVSDHLSSSAFMALAAKYPVKTHLKNSEPRESTLIVGRPCNTNPYTRDFINLTKWHRQREVTIEDFTDIASQVTTDEKDSNESQGSTTKCPGSSPEKKLTGSPDSGPGLVINLSSDDPTSESMVSSQNSVLSNQSSSDNLFQCGEQNCSGLGMFGSYTTDGPVGNASFRTPDFVGTRPTSYTQLLRMAESHGVEFSPAFSKETGAVVDVCSYSNISQLYPQNGSNYSGTSPTLNNSNMSSMYPQNGIYPPSDASAMVNGNKIDETFQTPDSEPRMRTHSPIVSRTPQPITPMIKITTSSGKTNGCIPLQEKKMCQVDSSQPPLQQPQPQAQSTPSASNLQNNPNANSYQTSKASSETVQGKQPDMVQKAMDGSVIDDGVSSKGKKGKGPNGKGKKNFDWDSLRRAVLPDGVKKERTYKTMDSLDYEALRKASVSELSDAIRERGMNNMLAERIKGFLDRIVNDHGSIDLEWLRDVDPDKAKDYLLSIRGLGLKSVECVRLLTLHHMAFPVDTNVGRICVRLGWVPLQPLPESLQLHLLEMYPILENIQKYLWPRLCKFDQRTLYELHYQMITFGKVFCTKSKPNCNACPMRAECKHFASAFASARLALPAPGEKGLAATALPAGASISTNAHSTFPPPQIEGSSTSSSSLPVPFPYPTPVNLPHANLPQPLPQSWASNGTVFPTQTQTQTCNEPIIEEPASPEAEPVAEKEIGAIEDAFLEEDPDEIPVIKLDVEEFTQNLKNYIQANNLEIEETNMSKAMVAISSEAASIPVPKLKNVSRLRTEHQVYELPDNHTLLDGFEPREPDDPSPYLLSIWTPGETAMSTEPPKSLCISQDVDELCDKHACARCASIKEARCKIVRGTILIPCRTAMRGSFPLNGTYFQVNEVFADHESSRTPIEISRAWIWNLPRRTVYFGTSIPTIFKGQSTEGIQHCFWRGFVCVRGFDRATRAPRPLYARLHFPASKVTRNSKKSTAAKDEV